MSIPLPFGQPLINGNYYSFASIEMRIQNQLFADITAINYSTGLDPADVYGAGAQKMGTTKGKQGADATLEMYLHAWEFLRPLLGGTIGSYGETRFPIIVQFAESPIQPVFTHTILGARVTKADYQNSEGNEATKVSLTLNVMRVIEDPTGLARIDVLPKHLAF